MNSDRTIRILLLCAASAVFALSTPSVRAERPIRTDDPYVVGIYRWEATAGAEWEHGSWTDGANRNDWRYSSSLDYGVSQRLELGAAWDALRVRSPGGDGTGDLTLHGKFFVSEAILSSYPDFAVDLRLKLPTANEQKGLGTGRTDLGVHLLWGWKANEEWGITARLGRVIVGDHVGLINKWELGLALRRVLVPGKTAFFEYTLDSNERELEQTRHRLGSGLRWDASPAITWDIRGELGLSSSVPDVDIAAGLTYRP